MSLKKPPPPPLFWCGFTVRLELLTLLGQSIPRGSITGMLHLAKKFVAMAGHGTMTLEKPFFFGGGEGAFERFDIYMYKYIYICVCLKQECKFKCVYCIEIYNLEGSTFQKQKLDRYLGKMFHDLGDEPASGVWGFASLYF